MNNEIMVSVSCLVYNHEKYLRKCLDGIVMQRTNFKFEVLVHDDASTDGSQDIIREYEEKYPDIIKPIYQTENQYSKGVGISPTYQYVRAKGKYFAECEGDDFWTDPYKLQKQFDIMEENSDCFMCVHTVVDVSEDGSMTNSFHPKSYIRPGVITPNDYFNFLYKSVFHPFQTSSYFLKVEVINSFIDENAHDFIKNCVVGDVRMVFTSLAMGNIYYIDEVMSCYRTNVCGGWTSKNYSNLNAWIEHQKKLISWLDVYNDYTNGKYEESIYFVKNKKCFYLYSLTNDYKACFKKEHRKYIRVLPLKERLYIFAKAYFPFIMDLYERNKRS